MSDQRTILDVLGDSILFKEELGENGLPLVKKRKRGAATISILFEQDLSETEIWPNGASEEWDAQDVKNMIEEIGWREFIGYDGPSIDIEVPDALEGKRRFA